MIVRAAGGLMEKDVISPRPSNPKSSARRFSMMGVSAVTRVAQSQHPVNRLQAPVHRDLIDDFQTRVTGRDKSRRDAPDCRAELASLAFFPLRQEFAGSFHRTQKRTVRFQWPWRLIEGNFPADALCPGCAAAAPEQLSTLASKDKQL